MKLIIAMSLALSISLAHAGYRYDDKTCLDSGRLAELIASIKENGQSEKQILKALKDSNARRQKLIESIVYYVYTMSPETSETRRTVYLKCKAGDFNG